MFCQQYIADQVKRDMKAKTKYYVYKICHQKHHIFFSKTHLYVRYETYNSTSAYRPKKTAIVKKDYFMTFKSVGNRIEWCRMYRK